MNKLRRVNFSTFVVSVVLIFVVFACENDYSFRGDSNSIALSTDTISFDTLYTGNISATSALLVYNNSGEDMTIDRIFLKNGQHSAFNICINGQNTNELTDIRLQRKDSLFVFLNVFPSATDEPQPYIIEDEIVVACGTNQWKCLVLAYGQNTILLPRKISSNTQLTDYMPYIITDSCIIDSSATLSIGPNAKLLLADNARIDVYGTLKMLGSRDGRIIVKSSNIDYYYNDIPGQWNAITLMPGSKSEIEFTEFANAKYALIADSASELSLRNIAVHDASRGAILAYGAKLDIANALLYNCGGPLIAAYGGETSVTHATLSNYFRWNARKQASVALVATEQVPELKHFTLTNSIIVGNAANELDIESESNSNILISNCLINLGKKTDTEGDERFVDIVNENNAAFFDRENFDFHLDSASVAIDQGNKNYATSSPLDLDGNSRLDDTAPDLGAFEFINQKK